MIELAVVLLVNREGELLLQLRDEHAPSFPGVWGLPGGHVEAGETVQEAAVRELWEEARLRSDIELQLFERQELVDRGRLKHYFYGFTSASQDDVVLGEGAAMVFLPASQILDGRPFAPGTPEVIARFLRSAHYTEVT